MLHTLFWVALWGIFLAFLVAAEDMCVKVVWKVDIENEAAGNIVKGPYSAASTVLMRFSNAPEVRLPVTRPGELQIHLSKETLAQCTSITLLSASGEVLFAEPIWDIELVDSEKAVTLVIKDPFYK